MTKAPFLALASALLLAPLPALAGGLPTRIVQYGDLDLTRAEGVARLERRLVAAARSVCPVGDALNLAAFMSAQKCRATALAASKTQTQLAIATARSTRQMASSRRAAPALR